AASCVSTLYCDLSFFFQAEDGIRDSSVTGVQTCALPIYPPTSEAWRAVCHGPQDAPRVPAQSTACPLSPRVGRAHNTARQIRRGGGTGFVRNDPTAVFAPSAPQASVGMDERQPVKKDVARSF